MLVELICSRPKAGAKCRRKHPFRDIQGTVRALLAAGAPPEIDESEDPTSAFASSLSSPLGAALCDLLRAFGADLPQEAPCAPPEVSGTRRHHFCEHRSRPREGWLAAWPPIACRPTAERPTIGRMFVAYDSSHTTDRLLLAALLLAVLLLAALLLAAPPLAAVPFGRLPPSIRRLLLAGDD